MTILYAQFVLYEGMLLSTALEVFFRRVFRADARARGGHERRAPLKLGGGGFRRGFPGLLLGALCGAGALGRPNLFLLLVAALPIWLCARRRGPARRTDPPPPRRARRSGDPSRSADRLQHAKATGRFVPVTAQGGINFYLGNRSGAPASSRARRRADERARGILEESRAMAETETGREHDAGGGSGLLYPPRFLVDIRANPAAWFRLLAKKLGLFLNGIELYDVPNVYFDEKSCGILKSLFLPFAVIAPLGLCGLVVLLWSGRNRAVISIFLGCAVLSVLLFFVNTRYRLPAVPLLILLAAYFVVSIARSLSLRRVKRVAIIGAAAALFFLVSHRSVVKVNHSAAYAFLGNHYIATKNEPKAEEAFAEGVPPRSRPDRGDAPNYAGILRPARGRTVESAGM